LNADDPDLRQSDAQKRHARNCDGTGERIRFSWAPDLRQCPRSFVGADGWEAIDWWKDWRRGFGLPFGNREALDEPAFIYEALRVAEAAFERAQEDLLVK